MTPCPIIAIGTSGGARLEDGTSRCVRVQPASSGLEPEVPLLTPIEYTRPSITSTVDMNTTDEDEVMQRDEDDTKQNQ